jgi:hypothetical protein
MYTWTGNPPLFAVINESSSTLAAKVQKTKVTGQSNDPDWHHAQLS